MVIRIKAVSPLIVADYIALNSERKPMHNIMLYQEDEYRDIGSRIYYQSSETIFLPYIQWLVIL